MKSELSLLLGPVLLALPSLPSWKLAIGGLITPLPPFIYETYPWWQTIFLLLVLLLQRNRGPRASLVVYLSSIPGQAVGGF